MINMLNDNIVICFYYIYLSKTINYETAVTFSATVVTRTLFSLISIFTRTTKDLIKPRMTNYVKTIYCQLLVFLFL